jgi:hypothetical protein
MAHSCERLTVGHLPAGTLRAARPTLRAQRPGSFYRGAFVCEGDPALTVSTDAV